MEIKPNMIIRCKTYKEAFELCHKIIKNKSINYIMVWVDFWKVYKSNTCYQVNNNCDGFLYYGDTEAFRNEEIILYSDLFNETTDNKGKEKKLTEQEIRNKAIDEFTEALRLKCIEDTYNDVHLCQIFKIAEQLKRGV